MKMVGKEESNLQKKKIWRILGGLGALLLAFGGRLKLLLPILKLLKLGKVGGTIWSMLLMIWAYTIIYPWEVSIGLVLMIFIHEMGHVVAAKRIGLPVSAPAFIPFLGALIMMKKQPQDAQTEAYVAFGGPLLGSFGALLCLLLGYMTGYKPLYVIAWIGFFLNLINLLPIHPLDGGRIVTAISRWLWLVGLIGGLLIIIFFLRSLLFFIIWAMFAWELYKAYIRDRTERKERIGEVEVAVRSRIFEQHYLPIAGPQHKRSLDFMQYSSLENRITYIEVFYPGIGSIGRTTFTNGLVTKAELVGTTDFVGDMIKLRIKIAYTPDPLQQTIKDTRYYQVPLRTRLIYGISYFGLAGLLGFLLLVVYQSTMVS